MRRSYEAARRDMLDALGAIYFRDKVGVPVVDEVREDEKQKRAEQKQKRTKQWALIKDARRACVECWGRNPSVDSIVDELWQDAIDMDAHGCDAPFPTRDEIYEDAERILEEIYKIDAMRPGPNFEEPFVPFA